MDFDSFTVATNRRLAALEEARAAVPAAHGKAPTHEQIVQAVEKMSAHLAQVTDSVSDIQKRIRDGDALDELHQAVDLHGPIWTAIKELTMRHNDIIEALDDVTTRVASLEQKADLLRTDLDRRPEHAAPRDRGLQGSPLAEIPTGAAAPKLQRPATPRPGTLRTARPGDD
jgi:Zn-dependent oligopeptidase